MGPAEKRLSLYGAALLGTIIVSGVLMVSNFVHADAASGSSSPATACWALPATSC
jgi:hypothetical protein